MTGKISPHLWWSELACHDAARTPYPARQWPGRAEALAVVFEAIRAVWGRSITVSSAYRTPQHNRDEGGASNSQHVFGRALDLHPPAGVSVEAFWSGIRQVARQLEGMHGVDARIPVIRGLGRYKQFVHIDLRPSSSLAVWGDGTAKQERV